MLCCTWSLYTHTHTHTLVYYTHMHTDMQYILNINFVFPQMIRLLNLVVERNQGGEEKGLFKELLILTDLNSLYEQFC